MDIKHSNTVYARLVAALCACIVVGILIVGLWPFHASRNDVSWPKNGKGLRFGYHGSAISASAFQANVAKDGTSCSLEIWLVPAMDEVKTILAFDSSVVPAEPFSLEQHQGDLVLKHFVLDQHGHSHVSTFKVTGVFREQTPVFLTITADKQSTAVYVDGTLAAAAPHFGMSSKDLTGQLVVANSTMDDSWAGEIMGLGMYHRQLTRSEVAKHYENWTKHQRPVIIGGEAAVGLYFFDEHEGYTVHNQIDPATDLTIPEHYKVLHPPLLLPAWRAYRFGWPGWSYWQDVAINIAGFVPVGFCFLLYFSSVRQTNRPAVTAIFLGFLLSLGIETLQRFLPSRDSDMTDVITNTLGTGLGVWICRWSFVQAILANVNDCCLAFVERRSKRGVEEDIRRAQAEKVKCSV